MVILLDLSVKSFFCATSAQDNPHGASNSCVSAWPLSLAEQPLVYVHLPKDSRLSSRRRSPLATEVRILIGVPASRPSNHLAERPEEAACPPMRTGPAYRDRSRPQPATRRWLLTARVSSGPSCHLWRNRYRAGFSDRRAIM